MEARSAKSGASTPRPRFESFDTVLEAFGERIIMVRRFIPKRR